MLSYFTLISEVFSWDNTLKSARLSTLKVVQEDRDVEEQVFFRKNLIVFPFAAEKSRVGTKSDLWR